MVLIKHYIFILAILLFFSFLNLSKGQTQITSANINAQSFTVNAITTLTFYAIPSTNIPTGGSIVLLFPSQITTQPGSACTLTQPTTTSTLSATCSYTTVGSKIQLTATITSGTINNYFELKIPSFKNPSSTTPTDSFQFSSQNAGKTMLDFQTTDIIFKATADKLTSISLTPNSQVIGNLRTVLTITMQLKNSVPQNGKVYVTFPYWNIDINDLSQQPSQIQSMVNTGVSCSVTTQTNAAASCSFDSSTQKLTLSNAFVSTLAGGSIYSFQINSIKNPIQNQLVSGFVVSTGDTTSGLIDTSTPTLQITQEAQISDASVTLKDYTIQKYTTYQLQFTIPVPLRSGCLIYVNFPESILLDSSLNSVSGSIFFGPNRVLSGTINTDTNTYQITNGCPTYMNNALSAVLTLSLIANPYYVMTTQPISIYIYDSFSGIICSTGLIGPTVTSSSNSINSVAITPETSIVDSITNFLFKLQPLSNAYQNSQILITFPTEITMPSTCSISSQTALVSSSVTCSISSQKITINNLFDSPYTYSSTNYLLFKIEGFQMPPSTAPTSSYSFTFSTFSLDNSQYNVLDQYTSTNLVTSSNGYLTIVSIKPSSYVVNAYTSYIVQFQIVHRLLKGSTITIILPGELALQSTSISNLCSSFLPALSGTAKCSSPDLQTVIASNWFTDAAGFTDTSQTLSFSIQSVQNPRSVSTTSSFKIYLKDQNGYLIDVKTDNMAITMSQTASIVSAEVIPSSFVIEAVTSYLFKISTPAYLINGDIIYVQFPTELGQPLANTFTSCSGVTYLSITLQCKLIGQYGVQLTVSISGSSSAKIPAKTVFQFKVNGVQNPYSSRPTSLFSVSVFDFKGAQINSMNSALTSFYTKMTIGQAFSSITITHISKIPLEVTTFILQFTLNSPIPANSELIVTYPTQISLSTDQFGCSVSVQSTSPICSYSSMSGNNNITIQNLNNVDISSGTSVQVKISGLINSQYSSATSSFLVYLYTFDNYIIAQATTGLIITNDCDYPCYTCMTGQPSKCLSCKPTSTFNILQNNQCISACPFGQYSVSSKCYPCDQSCLSCTGSASNCLSCKSGYYSLNNQCLTSCPSEGFYQNSQNYKCEQCKSPCYSCSSSVNSCTSCLSNVTQNLFYQGVCYSSCPDQISVNQNGVCVSCDSNCKTCTKQSNVCTSCDSSLKLDQLSLSCVNTCPSGFTVDMGNYCQLCDSSCKTCSSTSTTSCLTCQQGLYLNQVAKQCVTYCPKGTAGIIVQKTANTSEQLCSSCSTGCLECQDSINYCTKCDDSLNYLFFNFSCYYKTCPKGYTRLNSTLNVCIRNGLVCDFGYEFNSFGQCVLAVAQCKKGYILNRTKDACIPKPIFYIPFLFFVLALAWTIYLYIKHRKIVPREEAFTIIAQLLLGLIIIQTVSYMIMFGLSIWLKYNFILAAHLVGILGMYLCNLGGALYFKKKLRKEDLVFQHWVSENKRIMKIYTYIAALFNFKLLRGLYSKLRKDKPFFNAIFDEEYENIVRPLFYLTLGNFLVQVLPVILIDVYTLIFIPWGYQIMVMSIDNLILSLIVFILEIIEFRLHKQLYIKQGGKGEMMHHHLMNNNQYKGLKKEMDQSNVMGVFDDESQEQLKALRDQTIDLINNNNLMTEQNLYIQKQNIKSKGQTERVQKSETTEVKLLENLIRKFGEEKKFNELNDDNYDNISMQNNNKSMMEEELSLRVSNKQNLQPLSNQGKKYAIDQLRERIENKLLGRQPILKKEQEQTLGGGGKRKEEQQEDKLERQIKDLDVGSNLPVLPPLKDSKGLTGGENLESARTEKFHKYPQNHKLQNKTLGFSTTNLEELKKQQINKDAEDYNLFYEEIQERLDRSFVQNTLYVRNWHSFDEDLIRDYYEHEAECESDFGQAKSNYSFPFESNVDEYKDPQYLARLELFREKIKSTYQYNNLYAERSYPYKNLKEQVTATRRTQTYEKDVNHDADIFEHYQQYGSIFEEEVEVELDPDIAQNWINNVIIEGISENDFQSSLARSSAVFEKQSDSDLSQRGNKKKKRKREVQFELDDIMGAFDIDDFGNIILNEETMRDNFNRRVNKHGYLIDNWRNIINQEGAIIFEVDELDSDEELPMPYKFEQRKKQLMKSQEKFTIDPQEQMKHMEDENLMLLEDEKVEEELNRLKSLSKRSSMDSQIGDSPNKFDQQNNMDLEGEDDDENSKKKSSKYSRKDLQLARAYGGSPKPKQEKKKQKKRKRALGESTQSGRKLERQATDRLFPSLLQEEERVKKLQMLTHLTSKDNQALSQQNQEQKTGRGETDQRQQNIGIGFGNEMNLEQYMRNQMQEMNQFREKDREELKQQIEEENKILDEGSGRGYEYRNVKVGRGGHLQNVDSATTTKSFQNAFVGFTNEKMNNGIAGVPQNKDVLDPLQQLVQMESNDLYQFMPFQKYQNVGLSKNIQTQQYSTQQQQKYTQQQQNDNQYQQRNVIGRQGSSNVQPQSQLNFSAPQYQNNTSTLNASQQQTNTQEDLSPNSQQLRQDDQLGGGNIAGLAASSTGFQNQREERKTFGFYLVQQNQAKLKTKYHKADLKRKDSQLTNAGQYTLQGENKLKDLEGIYLKKFGSNIKGGNQQPLSVQRPYSQMRGGNLGDSSDQKQQQQQQRSIPLQSQNKQARFRPLQHEFVDEPGEQNVREFQSLGREHQEFESVFEGMQKAMNKIDQIRQQERDKGLGGRRGEKTINASSSAIDRGRLNIQNNNWV